jgi:hypothetical protein
MADQREPRLSELSPLTSISLHVFHCAKWLSPAKLLSIRFRRFAPRSDITQPELSSIDFTIRHSRAIEFYIISWFFIEIALAILSCFVNLHLLARFAIQIAVSIRIFEILQVAANATLFDSLHNRSDERYASQIRNIVIAGVNYIELWICFGIIYSFNLINLHGVRRPIAAFYFSIVTQLTIGFGDIYAIGWLRPVVAMQGLVGILFVILVFGRFVASLPHISGIFENRHSQL